MDCIIHTFLAEGPLMAPLRSRPSVRLWREPRTFLSVNEFHYLTRCRPSRLTQITGDGLHLDRRTTPARCEKADRRQVPSWIAVGLSHKLASRSVGKNNLMDL